MLHGRWDEEPLCPSQAFREALSRYSRRAPEELLRGDVGQLAPVLGRIVPEVLEASGVLQAERADAEGDRYQVFDAVDRWIRAIAERRHLVLVLDDMHWADRPSLLLLEYLLRSSTPAPVLIIATYRQTDSNVAGWFSESLAGIRRTTSVENIALAGLSPTETQELLEAAIGRTLDDHEAAGAVNLQRHTGGNPFFLQEVVRDLREAGRSLQVVVGGERRGAPASRGHARRRAVAPSPALGRCACGCCRPHRRWATSSTSATVGNAIDCDEETLLLALDEARLAGVVTESSRRFDTHCFTHAVVRQALYHELGLSRRTRLHRQLGQALERRYGADGPRHAAVLAHHFYLGASAGGVDDAVRYLRLAADDALQQVAYEAAADHLNRALELVSEYRSTEEIERCQLLLAIGRACVQAGRSSEANDRFLDAFELALRCGRPDLVAEAALGYGGVIPAGSEPNAKARTLLETALAELGPEDSNARALVLGRLAQWGHFNAPARSGGSSPTTPSPWPVGWGTPRPWPRSCSYRYWAMDGPDDIDRQIATAVEIRSLGQRTRRPRDPPPGAQVRAPCSLRAGRLRGVAAGGRRPRRARPPRSSSPSTCVSASCGTAWWPGPKVATPTPRPTRPRPLPSWNAPSIPSSTPSTSGCPCRGGGSRGAWRTSASCSRSAPPAGRRRERRRSRRGWRARSANVATPRKLLAGLTRGDVAEGDRNFHWWFVMVGLTQTALNLGDRAWAATLYDLIEPYADHNCRAGQATFLGAASLQLGALALLLGRDRRSRSVISSRR